jgi:hypothetical protein
MIHILITVNHTQIALKKIKINNEYFYFFYLFINKME